MSAPYLELLGLSSVEKGDDRARCTLAFDGHTANSGGTLHGGVTASLALVTSRLAAGDGAMPVNLALSYLAPGSASDVVAEATVLRRGNELAHVDVSVRAGGREVAHALCVQRVGPGAPAPVAEVPQADAWPEPLPPGIASRARFSVRLGVSVLRRSRGHAVAVLPWNESLRDERGAVHAGALASLMDSAGGGATWSVVKLGPRGRSVTVALHLAVHAPAHDEDIIAQANAVAGQGGLVTAAIRLSGRRTRVVVGSGSATYRVSAPE